MKNSLIKWAKVGPYVCAMHRPSQFCFPPLCPPRASLLPRPLNSMSYLFFLYLNNKQVNIFKSFFFNEKKLKVC